MTLLDDMLQQTADVSAAVEAQKSSEISAEVMAQLETDIEEIRAKSLRGERQTLEEMRKVVAYFRARRSEAFKAAPAKKRKAAPKRKSKKAALEAAALEALKNL